MRDDGIAAVKGELFPWQSGQWRVLMSERDRFPHSLLVHGPAGLGKRDFALALSQALLCLNVCKDGSACGHCKSCRLFLADSHPDFFLALPDEKSGQIRIETARELKQFAELTASVAHIRVALLIGADGLNRNAANALLKTLEEPGSALKLILVADRISRLPPTVRSRCLKLRFSAPPRVEALAWLSARLPEQDAAERLDLMDGRPLAALAADEGIALHRQIEADLREFGPDRKAALALAERWRSHDLDDLLGALARMLAREVRLRCSDRPAQGAVRFLTRLSVREIFGLYDKLLAHRRCADIALDARLVVEDLLLDWACA